MILVILVRAPFTEDSVHSVEYLAVCPDAGYSLMDGIVGHCVCSQ